MPARTSLASGLYAHGFFCNYIGMQFPTEDPEDRKRIIRDRLRQVHKHQP